MPEPIIPNPMNPIFISPSRDAFLPYSALPLLEYILGDERRGHRCRPAGVEGEMGDHFAELVLAETVIQRPLQVACELPFTAERDEGRAGNQAAVALGESRTLPDFAEQHPLAEIDQPRHDIADLLAGRRGLCLRHGFLLLDPTVRSGASLARGSPPTAIISVHVRV